jgi:hypothetical protein
MEMIYRTDGEWVAVYHEGHLFTVSGDWLGFVDGRQVFDTSGEYLGFLSDDRRLLRRRRVRTHPPRQEPPPRPERPRLPATAPLPPLFRSLPFNIVDVFEEEGDSIFYISDTRPDMD